MNISIAGGSIPEARQIAKEKSGADRQAKALKSVFERFKETMPDGSIHAAVRETFRHKERAGLAKRLQFAFDKSSGQVIVNVIDANTGAVIKVLPPKELQRKGSRAAERPGFLLDKMI